MRILEKAEIQLKISRLAMEVLEQHIDHKRLFLVGINNNGFATAELLKAAIDKEGHKLDVQLRRIKLSPADPLHGGIEFEGDPAELDGEHVIIVDDVANTGRTAFYASKPILEVVPASLEIAVLVDRKHKSFPVHNNYVGLALATTLQNDIRVYYGKDWRVEVF
ncbi:MAG: phosphoribosyltransferase family protein [Saprospiraceae bacterium]